MAAGLHGRLALAPAIFAAIAGLLAVGGDAVAQGTWMRRAGPSGRIWHRSAFDAAHGRTVIFGGYDGQNNLGDTWAYDGRRWIDLAPATSPSARLGFGMAYDSLRARVVVFGGDDGSAALNDTWEFDGATWTAISTAASPSARTEHAMAYSSGSAETVLFGGYDANGLLRNDRWKYNGVTWVQQSGPAASRPPARTSHAMAYDAARGRMVMFGGQNDVAAFSDTWEHDGNSWIAIPAAGTPPPALIYHSMAYDSARARVVMFGGYNASPDTWEFDGAQWTVVSSPQSPGGRELPSLAYDSYRGRCVMFGGDMRSDTWEFDGATWGEVASVTNPGPRYDTAMEGDVTRSFAVLFGGEGPQGRTNDTWHFDGSSWIRRHPVVNPQVRSGHAMAFDLGRAKTLLFGGGGGNGVGLLGDTWEYDGSNWTNAAPAASPPARLAHAMAYDITRGRTVLFGGLLAGAVPAGDVWEYDGVTWTPVPGVMPPARWAHAMAYDAGRQRMVMFGGRSSFGLLGAHNDTWEYDGTSWSQVFTAQAPTARFDHAMTFDYTGQGRILLFGGEDLQTFAQDTWSYDGTAWTPLTVTTSPEERHSFGLAYDVARGHAVLFGGVANSSSFGDTWEFHPTTSTAAYVPFGAGCPGSNGLPVLTNSGTPRLGEWFSIELSGGLPSSLAIAILGFSSVTWGTIPLPLPLDTVGAPGCTLLTGLDQLDFALMTPAGGASVAFRVPNTHGLMGLDFYQQFAVLDSTINALGLVGSNGGHGTVGNQ